MRAQSFQLCLILCNPMDCSTPGSSVHGSLQARILEWVAMPFSRGSSRPRDWTCTCCISYIAGGFFTHWATWEAHLSHIMNNSFFFYWSKIALQCSASFCYLTTWTSYLYTNVPCLEPPSHSNPHPTHLGQHWAELSAKQQAPSSIYFTHSSVYMSKLFSQSVLPSPAHPWPPVCSLHLNLASCPANRSICTTNIYALIYNISFSLSDLLHIIWQTQSPPMSLQMTQFCSFLWLSNIPSCIHTISSLPIHLLMDV